MTSTTISTTDTSGRVGYTVYDAGETGSTERTDAQSEVQTRINEQTATLQNLHDSGDLDDLLAFLDEGDFSDPEKNAKFEAILAKLTNDTSDGQYFNGTDWVDDPLGGDYFTGKVGPLAMFSNDDIDKMVETGVLDADEGRMIKFMRGNMEMDPAELATVCHSFSQLTTADQDFLADLFDLGETSIVADYDGAEQNDASGNDDLSNFHLSLSPSQNSSDTWDKENALYLLENMTKGQADAFGNAPSDSTMFKDLVIIRFDDHSPSETDLEEWNALPLDDGYAGLDMADQVQLRDLVNDYVGVNQTADLTTDVGRAQILSEFNVSPANAQKLDDLAVMLGECSSMTDDEKVAVFLFYATGGRDAGSADASVLEKFMSEPAVLDELTTGDCPTLEAFGNTQTLAYNKVVYRVAKSLDDAKLTPQQAFEDLTGVGQLIDQQWLGRSRSTMSNYMSSYRTKAQGHGPSLGTFGDGAEATLKGLITTASTYGDREKGLTAADFMTAIGMTAAEQEKFDNLADLLGEIPLSMMSYSEKQNVFGFFANGGDSGDLGTGNSFLSVAADLARFYSMDIVHDGSHDDVLNAFGDLNTYAESQAAMYGAGKLISEKLQAYPDWDMRSWNTLVLNEFPFVKEAAEEVLGHSVNSVSDLETAQDRLRDRYEPRRNYYNGTGGGSFSGRIIPNVQREIGDTVESDLLLKLLYKEKNNSLQGTQLTDTDRNIAENMINGMSWGDANVTSAPTEQTRATLVVPKLHEATDDDNIRLADTTHYAGSTSEGPQTQALVNDDFDVTTAESYMALIEVSEDDRTTVLTYADLIESSAENNPDFTTQQQALVFNAIMSGGTNPPLDDPDVDAAMKAFEEGLGYDEINQINDLGVMGEYVNDLRLVRQLPDSTAMADRLAETKAKIDAGMAQTYMGATAMDDVWTLIQGGRIAGDRSPTAGAMAGEYNWVVVTEENALETLKTMPDLGLSDDEMAAMATRMADGEMTSYDIALLNFHANNDADVPQGAFDISMTAIGISGGDKTYTDEAVGKAFEKLSFSKFDLSEEEFAALEQAAKDGTMSSQQAADFLFALFESHDLTADESALLNQVYIDSAQHAATLHADEWADEVTNGEDTNGDGVIGDPFANSIEELNEKGVAVSDLKSGTELLAIGFIDRISALEDTAEKWAKLVEEKNELMKQCDEAISAVTDIEDGEYFDPTQVMISDPDKGEISLYEYAQDNNITLPDLDPETGLCPMNSNEVDLFRDSLNLHKGTLTSESTSTTAQFSDAMTKLNTAVSQFTDILTAIHKSLEAIMNATQNA